MFLPALIQANDFGRNMVETGTVCLSHRQFP